MAGWRGLLLFPRIGRRFIESLSSAYKPFDMLRRTITQRLFTSAAFVRPRVSVSLPAATRVSAVRSLSFTTPRWDHVADAEEQIRIGTDHMNNGAIDMAMNSYHRSVQLAPSAAGYFNIGVCYFQMGKHRDAIQAFERSLEYSPNSADAHTNIASAYLMLKDVKSAMRHLEQASNFNPLDGEVQFNLAVVKEATGDLEGAKARFERAKDLGIDKAQQALDKLAKKMQ
ncbi:uncharacterized protein BYT42DRAFT_617981 [Radiomyces spectabilis]|uniref:uncharacterized protein n=1 Tax=Radiomyces spectabilis TaxID=64574 RepID=UPI002220964A|nr:uncharacterized protein BYT42DRAFT_617981 [Radiomyces spectabilis]KAI8367559.1 hypothetical protein BYT42DRAFT_617981 [Radiomyces spectabilis]